MTAARTPVQDPDSVIAFGKWINVSGLEGQRRCTKENTIVFGRDKDDDIGGIH